MTHTNEWFSCELNQNDDLSVVMLAALMRRTEHCCVVHQTLIHAPYLSVGCQGF
jgi:hypothetical protein